MQPVAPTPRSVFLEAVESVSPDRWPRFVEEACAGDETLRQQVLRLLNAHQAPGTFMAGPAVDMAAAWSATIVPPSVAAVGTRIGPYKLLEQIGEGGMGIVYVAEQTEPIRRRVALKIIKPGMDSRQVIARFEAERQALALMDHPNIATVLDAGVSDAGLPYFVMELVRGLPITEYCDAAKLTPVQRIELLLAVCQAVQHAHQKGIIHRDLKPSNVMVTLHDGKPVPKVIDFGVAKAIGQRLSEHTVYTAFTQIVGTPLYMSPEQAELSGLDVDTRSDVYSLGVLLYELLTGLTPFESGMLFSKGLDEMRRIIREDEPPRPSHRVSTLKVEARSTLSANRGLDERRLSPVLSGELDWIVMKSLEKERDRRYESVSALAADLQRYLADEPVLACPPSFGYRLRKLIRHHRPAIATTAVAAVALVIGLAVAVWQAVRANQERNRANQTAERVIEEARRAEDKAFLADQQRLRAEEAERQQRRQTERAENLLYAGDIRLAFRSKQAGDDEQAQRMLDAWLPQLGGRDRRGIEWGLLQRHLQIPSEELLHLPGDVSCVRIAPDGTYLVTATDRGLIERYNFSTRQRLTAWETGLTDVRRMEFSPNGKLLAVISYEAEAVVVETTRGLVRMRCPRPAAASANPDVCFVDGRLLTTGQGGVASLWNLEQGILERTWDVDCDTVLDAVHVPGQSGLILLTSHDDANAAFKVQFFPDLTGEKAANQFVPDSLASVIAVSPDGQTLAVGGQWGEVDILDIPELKRVATWTAAEKVNELVFSPDGKLLAAAERSGVVHVWRWQAATEPPARHAAKPHVHWQAHARPARSAVFAPDSQQLITAGFDGRIVRWVWNRPEAVRVQTPPISCRDLLILPGLHAVAAVDSEALRVFELQGGALLATLSPPTFPIDIQQWACDDDGDWLALDADSGVILCANLQQGFSLTALPNSAIEDDSLHMLAFLPGTRTVVAVEYNPGLRVRAWDVEQRRLLFDRRFDAIVPYETTLARQDGGLLVLTEDSLLRMDLLSGEVRNRWPCDGRDVSCATATSDGTLLAIGRKDRTIVLLDVATGQERHTLLGHLGRLRKLEFAPDGRTLLALDVRGALRFWHVASGTELLTLPSAAPIQRFDLSADGRWLAVSRRGEIELHDTKSASALP